MLNKTDERLVYHYSLRDGKFVIREGMVFGSEGNEYVCFKKSYFMERYPKEEDFGVLHTVENPNLWLTKRDDDLAKRLIKDYEESIITGLQKQINERIELINVLERGS